MAREEAERVAREEAERVAREEAERVAREEAERVAREEAERVAREEAERVAREEAERIAAEAAERASREKEEAERAAQEKAIKLVAPPPVSWTMPISLDADHLADELAGIAFDELPVEPPAGRIETPVPASTPRAKEEPSLAVEHDTFAAASDQEAPEEEAPPISGEVGSQRFARRAAPSEPPPVTVSSPPAPVALDVRLVAEPAPVEVPLPPALVEAPPTVVEVTAEIVRRAPLPAGAAVRFLAASKIQAPASFGELLDASLDLGAALAESMTDDA